MGRLTLDERIQILAQLGNLMRENRVNFSEAIEKASLINPWFTPQTINDALDAIAINLKIDALKKWTSAYDIEGVSKRNVGLVLAGNIPAVGFHDLLCTFITGHCAYIKPSDKDIVLIEAIIQSLYQINPFTLDYLKICDKIKDVDAIIATGSNNTSRYFEMYFSKYPHIIRKNKHSIAILNGQESDIELHSLGKDIFQYFGLGCRNVAKLYVPENYDFTRLLNILHQYNHVINNNKYKNNFDYNIALFMLNKAEYLNNGAVMLVKEKSLASRIASVNYEYYRNNDHLQELLKEVASDVQCIVSMESIENYRTVLPGNAQCPQLDDYADGVNTMDFLTKLK